MNTTFKSVALALGLGLATTTAKAQEASFSTVIDSPAYIAKMITYPNSSQMKVMVANTEGKKLFFTVRDEKGNALYSKIISKYEPQAFIRLNMEELTNGVYKIEIGDSKTHASKTFRKGGDTVVSRPIETLVAIN
jgi:hypothetical protein